MERPFELNRSVDQITEARREIQGEIGFLNRDYGAPRTPELSRRMNRLTAANYLLASFGSNAVGGILEGFEATRSFLEGQKELADFVQNIIGERTNG